MSCVTLCVLVSSFCGVGSGGVDCGGEGGLCVCVRACVRA